MSKVRMPLLAICLLSSGGLWGQCSDAGLCTLEKAAAGTGHWLGVAIQSASSGKEELLEYRTLRIEGQLGLAASTKLLFQLPVTRIEGPRGTVTGMGDMILALDQKLLSREGWFLAAQVGARVPTGKDNGSPQLPQAYQTGLGGTDILGGVRVDASRWAAGLAYQHAGTRSSNQQTRLQRGNDLLFWGEFRPSHDALQFAFKALAIQRLGRSSVREPGTSAERFVEVPDSDRLQVNLVASVRRKLGESLSLEASAALPLLKRPTNEDGLKRRYTAGLGVIWSF